MSEQTTQAPISWDAVRMLAVAVGVREAARRLGINEETVKKRCTREGWLNDPAVREATARSVEQRSASVTLSPQVSPQHAMAMELQRLNSGSRLSLARGLSKAATTIEQLPGEAIVADASNVKSIVQATAQVHSWADQQPGSRMRLEVLLTKPEVHVDAIEIQSEVVQDQWDADTTSVDQA